MLVIITEICYKVLLNNIFKSVIIWFSFNDIIVNYFVCNCIVCSKYYNSAKLLLLAAGSIFIIVIVVSSHNFCCLLFLCISDFWLFYIERNLFYFYCSVWDLLMGSVSMILLFLLMVCIRFHYSLSFLSSYII